MHYSQSNSITIKKLGKSFALAAIVSLGLLSIVGTGGGGGGDPDPEPGTLQFSAATYSGNEDAGDITVTVTRIGGSDGAATVDVSDANSGTATSGTDYTAITTTTLSWADGESTVKTINVAAIADGVVESDETVDLALGNVTGASLGTTTSATVTITNDDATPGTLQFSTSSYSGSEDAGNITVTVTRTGGSTGAASVDVSDASSGSATSGTDYTAISTTLIWVDGDASAKTLPVSPIADGAVEVDETVDLALGNATGATLGSTTSATVTILNDDALVPGTLQFSMGNYSAAEGDGNATITVTRAGGSDGAVTVTYTASNGTATAGSDFTAVSSTLIWNNGDSSSQTFQVPIINDTDVEVPESVNLTLSNPIGGATLGNPNSANLTITSEDKFGTIRFGATSYNVDEADGTVTNVITLERVDGSSGTISVDVTDDGSGNATGSGTDYTYNPNPMEVSWPNGDTTNKNVTIVIIDDGDSENTETVNLSLGNAIGGASIGSPSTATVNIADDDAVATPGELMFDAASYLFAEDGGSVTITVNRVNGTLGPVGVSYATSDNTATAGVDYTATSDTLSWGNGVGGAQTFSVALTADTDVEPNETVTLFLSVATGGATLGTPNVATLIISNDDTNLTMNIGDGTYWVAFQDGPIGTWTEWTPSSANIYDFPVTDSSGRYGVAFHRQETDGVNTVEKTYVVHATVAEMDDLPAFSNAPYTVSGTLRDFATDSAGVGVHTRDDGGELITDPYVYTLPRIPAGTRDILAVEWDSTTGALGNVIRREISVAGNLTNQDVDFDTDSDSEVITKTDYNFEGSAVNQVLAVYYATNNGTAGEFDSATYDGVNPLVYPYITNSSLTQAGDTYSFQINNNAYTRLRIRNQSATSDPGNQSLGLGSLNSLTGTSSNTTQTTGLSYSPNGSSFNNAPVFRGFQIDLDQTVIGRSGGAHWKIMLSDGWLGASTTYMHPALSSISGFNAGWDMSSGVLTHVTATAVTTNNGTGLRVVTRKSIGPDWTGNLNSGTWVVREKYAQNDTFKADFAYEFSNFTW